MFECERAGLPDDDLRRRLYDVRRSYGRSTFVRRLQTWPRGYPGDWETIDYLLDGVNRTAPDDFAHQLERYALWCAAAQQHRNKVSYQAALCSRRHFGESRPRTCSRLRAAARGIWRRWSIARPASRARSCSTTPTRLRSRSRASGSRRSAIAACSSRATPSSCDRASSPLGPYDLVLAGGLFDYLPDAIAIRLLRTVYREYLAPGGTFFFTNIAKGNPYRLWMGVIGTWSLLERSEEDVRRLCARAGVPDADVDLARDTSGLAWLVHAKKR